MKQGTTWTLLLGFLASFVVLPPARAALIGFQPTPQAATLGSSFSLELTISGLGSGIAPSLGAYDLDISFDSSMLSLNSITFGDPVFGNQLDLFGFGSINATTPASGFVNLFELSLDPPSILDSLQADSFTLAVFTFTTLAVGSSLLSTSINALGDSFGNPLAATTVDGSVQVVAVAEPASFLLFGIALCTLIFVSGKRLVRPGSGDPAAG